MRVRRSPLRPMSVTCEVVSTRCSSRGRQMVRSRSVIRVTTSSSRRSASRRRGARGAISVESSLFIAIHPCSRPFHRSPLQPLDVGLRRQLGGSESGRNPLRNPLWTPSRTPLWSPSGTSVASASRWGHSGRPTVGSATPRRPSVALEDPGVFRSHGKEHLGAGVWHLRRRGARGAN